MKKFKLGPWQRAWIRSLRNGFKQISGYLCRTDKTGEKTEYSFCCLGVACEMFLENDVPLRFEEKSTMVFYGESHQFLPSELWRELRLYSAAGKINKEHLSIRFSSLAELNDNDYSFEQIANLLEKHPEAFFSEPN